MGDPTIEEGFFNASDGLRLFFRTEQSPNPAAHVVVLHGYAEHLGRHRETTRALVDARYTVHLMDCRGHGKSGGKRAHVERFDEYLADLDVFLERVRKQAAGKPVFLFGHSHGGLIAARYLLDNPDAVRGVVLSSPYLRLKLQVPAVKILAAKLLARILPSLPMKNALNAEQLTRDVQIQKETRADPLYQRIATPGWFAASSDAQEMVLRRATEFVTPFLLAFGGADGIADPAAGREFFDAATSKDKQYKQYDGLLHELGHEPERALVFKDLVGWLDERAGTPASVAASFSGRA